MKQKLEKYLTPGALILILSVLFAILHYFRPLEGDDLRYLQGYIEKGIEKGEFLLFPRFAIGYWLGCDGRCLNAIVPGAFIVGAWFTAILSGLAFWMMFHFTVKSTQIKNQTLAFLLILTLALSYPWWDYQHLFVCVTNYIAAVSLGLWAYCLIRDTGDKAAWWKVAICLIAGSPMEGMSIPLCVGLWGYVLFSSPKVTRAQKWLVGAFTLGMLISVFSPGTIRRLLASEEVVPNDTPIWLLLKSDAAVLVLYAVMAICLIFKSGRQALKKLLCSPMLVLVIASAVSAVICVFSGIVGRSGVFGQIFALIVLCSWAGMYFHPKCLVLNALISILLIAQYIGLDTVQYRLLKEYEQFEAAYRTSPDGVVAIDATKDNELPWWTLNALRGIPDADDSWLNFSAAAFHRTDSLMPVVIPTEALNYLPVKADSVALSDGSAVMSRLPNVPIDTVPLFKGYTLLLADINGRQYTIQPLRGGWFVTPRILDPGDR